MARAFSVLYTNKPHLKRLVFKDGYVLVKARGAAALLDEDGRELAQAQLPASLVAGSLAGEEGLRCFEGYLVNGEDECDPAVVPGVGGGQACVAGRARDEAMQAEQEEVAPAPPLGRTAIVRRAAPQRPGLSAPQAAPLARLHLPVKRPAAPLAVPAAQGSGSGVVCATRSGGFHAGDGAWRGCG